MTGLNWKRGDPHQQKAVYGSADEVFSVSGGRGIMIVLILFTICQFTLLIMNHMLFQGIPSAWNQIGIPVVAISFFTEGAGYKQLPEQ